jgi:putative Mg2+ transporter-C (MgtC) family protein
VQDFDVSHPDLVLLSRIAVGFGLAFLFGFERQLRGAPAGDRTFSLVGAAAAAIASVTGKTSPAAVAGIVTGIGFIGGGVVFRSERGTIRGITTAASIFAVAAMGIVVGYGHLALGAITAGILLVVLELPHTPGLRLLDASRYRSRFRQEDLGHSEPAPPRAGL